MKTDSKETRLGTIWFLVAGPLAVCLVVFLALFDHNKTYSDAEAVHGEMMREVRMAQASLNQHSIDPRIKAELPLRAEKITESNVPVAEEHHAEHH